MKPGTCLARSRSLGLARFRSHALIVSTRARWLKAKAPERGPQHSLAAWPLLLCCCLVRISSKHNPNLVAKLVAISVLCLRSSFLLSNRSPFPPPGAPRPTVRGPATTQCAHDISYRSYHIYIYTRRLKRASHSEEQPPLIGKLSPATPISRYIRTSISCLIYKTILYILLHPSIIRLKIFPSSRWLKRARMPAWH